MRVSLEEGPCPPDFSRVFSGLGRGWERRPLLWPTSLYTPISGDPVVTDPHPPSWASCCPPPIMSGCDTCRTVESAGLGLCFRQALASPRGWHCDRVTGAWGDCCVCGGVGGPGILSLRRQGPVLLGRGCQEAEQQPLLSLAPTNTKPWGPLALFLSARSITSQASVHQGFHPGALNPLRQPGSWGLTLPHPASTSAATLCSPPLPAVSPPA